MSATTAAEPIPLKTFAEEIGVPYQTVVSTADRLNIVRKIGRNRVLKPADLYLIHVGLAARGIRPLAATA
jgi:hypothetical protein